MMTFKDQYFAIRKLNRLREIYPDSTIVVRSDGKPNEYPETYKKLGVTFYLGERMFTIDHGAELAQRMLEHFLDHSSKYMIKVDPDTVISNPLTYLPAMDCHFGTVYRERSIQGGCAGFTYAAAKEVYDSKLLLSKDFYSPEGGVLGLGGLYEKELSFRATEYGLTSLDWAYAACCRKLGIRLYNHPEVNCNWDWFKRSNPSNFAFLHPDLATQRYFHFAESNPWNQLHY